MGRDAKFHIPDGGFLYRKTTNRSGKAEEVGAYRMRFMRREGNFVINVDKSTDQIEAGAAVRVATLYADLARKVVNKQANGLVLSADKVRIGNIETTEYEVAGLPAPEVVQMVGALKEQIAGLQQAMSDAHRDARYIEGTGVDVKIVLDQMQRGKNASARPGELGLSDLTTENIRAALSELKKNRKWSARSYQRARYATFKFCDHVRIKPNPVADIEVPDPDENPVRPARPFADDELVALISEAVAHSLRDAAMIFMGMYSGLRASHLRGVTRDKVEVLKDGVIVTPPVKNRLSKKKRATVNAITDPWAVEVISKYVATLKADDKLFPVDRPYCSRMIRKYAASARAAWIDAAKEAKVKEERMKSDFLNRKDRDGFVIHFHALRNTFITRAFGANIPDARIQAMAGHSRVEQTRGYDRPANEALIAQANMIPHLHRPKRKVG